MNNHFGCLNDQTILECILDLLKEISVFCLFLLIHTSAIKKPTFFIWLRFHVLQFKVLEKKEGASRGSCCHKPSVNFQSLAVMVGGVVDSSAAVRHHELLWAYPPFWSRRSFPPGSSRSHFPVPAARRRRGEALSASFSAGSLLEKAWTRGGKMCNSIC